MALWDPEAAGNAAIYLRLPDIDLIDIRNAPFEGKTAVWVPYADTGYTKGKKIGEKGDKIEVERLVDNKVKEYKKEQVEPQNPPKPGIDSVSQMAHKIRSILHTQLRGPLQPGNDFWKLSSRL